MKFHPAIFTDSVITPTRHVVSFGDDDFLIEATHSDEELRPLVPQVDEMFDRVEAVSGRDAGIVESGDYAPTNL